jgi:hypothetical protein
VTLLDELRADRSNGGKTCSVCTWLQGRDKAERAEWIAAFADPSISANAIFRAMKAREFGYSDSVVGKHRRARHELD